MKDRIMSDQAEAAPTSTEPSIVSESTCQDTVTAAATTTTTTNVAAVDATVANVLTNDLKELKDTGSSSCSTSSSTTPTPVTSVAEGNEPPSGNNTSSSSSTVTNTTGPSSPSSSPQTAPNMPVPTAVTSVTQPLPAIATTVVAAPGTVASIPGPPVNSTNYEVTQNGHMSPVADTMVTNGVVLDQSAAAGQNGTFIVHSGMLQGPGVPVAGPTTVQAGPTRSHRPPPAGGPLQQPGAGNHRAHSPHRYSPNGPHSRGNSPHNGSSAAPNQQHVVHVHINPGETFSVRVGDQIQHIQGEFGGFPVDYNYSEYEGPNMQDGFTGPATVRMVSNTGPPLPMPMQVSPGHMVQQIVDENGILTHVILSPQPQGMPPAPPMTVGYYGGPNSAPQQIYSPYPQYAYPTHTQYGPHHHPHHPPPPPHMHHVPPPHLHGTPTPPPQCNNHGPHVHHASPGLVGDYSGGPGGPPPHHNHLDDRTVRQKQRLQDKLQRRKDTHYYPPSSLSRSKNKSANGSVDPRRTDHSSSSSADGHELEEERRTIRALLSKMKLPKVSNVDARSALIQLTPPECNPQEYEILPTEFKYELLLSEKGCNGKYKLVYSGDATEITLQDLKPALEYHLKVCSILDDLKGDQTDPVSFRTQCCQPDPPLPPKLSTRTKTTLLLKWNAATDNGSKVTGYALEYDHGQGDRQFTEIYCGLQRQYKVTKLTASTGYTFRLAAINAQGKSKYCEPVCFYTSGSAPSQPDPPMLGDQFVNALTISWIKRPNDDEFTLQMEDEVTGHGFLTVYNGSDLSHKIETLRRNTEYKFRLSANNDEGNSKWSDVVCYRTLPDRPSPPPKPQIKGKVHPNSFRVMWDPPRDNGGSEVSRYHLELDDSRGYVLVYEGLEREFCCDQLLPGHAYRVHVASSSVGGKSDWSDCLTVQTQAVPPGVCQPPKLQGKAKATLLHLRWNYPDYDGGAPVTEFEILMTLSDNTTREVYRGRDLDCTVAGLSPGRSYLFQVRASNKAGVGNWSELLEVVSGAGVPDPPKSLMVNCKSPQLAVIMWDEPVNNGATITDYRLEWQLRPDADFTQLYYGAASNFEVRGLTPATLYSFRVQALNSAGAGPFSTLASCVTPPSSPGAVTQLRATSTATSIQLSWREPQHNGSDIISYNIDLGEKHLISVSDVLEHVINDLLPETTYKVRVQAVNGIGVGAFSSMVKVTTSALPPNPPRLECINFTHNSLKLKWGDGRNPDLIQYDLEMMRDNGSFQSVYHGTAHTYKVNKLTELTHYCFRIYASNDAGEGPCSEKFVFRTSKAPPPSVRPPKVSDVVLDSCQVEWQACRPMGQDSIIYCLQLQNVHSRDMEYKPVYRGADTSYRLEGLAPKTEYQVRVCAVRVCVDGTSDLTGAYSPGVSFVTQAPKVAPIPAQTTSSLAKLPEAKQLTDQHWAMIILLGFTIFAGIIAFLAQQIIAYTNNNSNDTAQ